MFNEKISVIDFFMEIQAVASEKGVNLTHSNKRVYLSLLDFADKFPQETIKTNKGIRFNSTTAKWQSFVPFHPVLLPRVCLNSINAVLFATPRTDRTRLLSFWIKHFTKNFIRSKRVCLTTKNELF